MTPDRWQQVDELFQAAIELNPAKRAAFLDTSCAGDEELRREVDSLITFDEQGLSLIDAPAFEAAAGLLVNDGPELQEGERIGHYQIINLLGAGGMGEVYLAQDTELRRKIAIKLLPAEFTKDKERLRRFQQEARSASALNHPNIITIHQISQVEGRHFMATEFIDGETLRQRLRRSGLELGETVDIAIQVASALSAAHQAGIVHRDIKPENIMLRPDGYVKVLDFGLAKLTEQEEQGRTPIDTDKIGTSSGLVMGTVKYMSPEQARGLDVDARSDIFSFGVVLYEMVVGLAPFEGETTGDLIASILKEEPVPLTQYAPTVRDELQRILSRTLRKEKKERYQSIQDLLKDLKDVKEDFELESKQRHSAQHGVSLGAVSTSAARSAVQTLEAFSSMWRFSIGVSAWAWRRKVLLMMSMASLVGFTMFLTGASSDSSTKSKPPIESIALVPFENATGDSEVDYLSDGLTEEVIARLSKLPGLRVIARNTMFKFKGKQNHPETIGHELGVAAVLTGRVQRQGDLIEIQVDLFDVQTGKHLWGEEISGKTSELTQIQASLAARVIESLRVKFNSNEIKRQEKDYSKNPEAYQLYLRGRYFWNKRTVEGTKKGIDSFQQALKIDPNFAPAYSGLADCYEILGGYSVLSPDEAFTAARLAATKAIEIDESLAEAHSSLGDIKQTYEWDFAGAELEYKRAIELNPNYANVYHKYSGLLRASGKHADAIAVKKKALELDPLSLIINAGMANVYLFAGLNDQAIDQARKTLELEPNFPKAHEVLGSAFMEKGMYREAITEYQKARDLDPGIPDYLADIGCAYARSGRRHEAEKVLDELKEISKRQHVSPYVFALIYTALADKDQAFAWLERGYQERAPGMSDLKSNPGMNSLHSDQRYVDLLRRIGLPP